MNRVLGVLPCVLLLNAGNLCAQTGASAPASASTVAAGSSSAADPSAGDPTPIDPTKLGISFDRVRIKLAEPAPSKTKGLKIQETIEVVGVAPKLQIWDPKTVNLTSQAVPFGAPTQKDIMKLIVPKEFQTYPFDLNALMQWLMEHLNKKAEE